ncbi:MAG: helix-turn-helix transcriptional regulator [Pseudomonadota bacterium]|nr:helix-turn-helix transcriptional regulator [Pseudomonadota bacterium]MEC8274440.1 helix-turn-helix transcriptional regulator [Pseudomonadota bacterium]MEC8711264.1 helix-turn-helix transcriptional regulator [Pseudomonadota bacterium]
MTPFGEKLVSLREQRGWTQKKMAEKLGVSAAFLSALENGQRGKPSRRLLHAICQTFGIIWDEADALADLAAASHPVVKLNTRGLSATHTRFAHALAGKIAELPEEQLEDWLKTLEDPKAE